MKREDFMFTIGYQGETAIVDKKARSQFGSLSTDQLIDAGLYKPAFCSALFDENQEDQAKVLKALNASGERTYASIDEIKRLLGVYQVPDGISKMTYI